MQKFVSEKGEVNYQSVLREPQLLDQYLEKLSTINLAEVREEWPREEELALWLNVYHVGIVLAVRQHGMVKTLNGIPGIWDMVFIPVGGHRYSLDVIRRTLLMDEFRDEKIHTALSCGAKSCPKFPREAFTGPRVEGQLFLAAREFVNDPDRNKIIPGEKKIWISRIFKWYARDFLLDFGAPQNDRNLPDDEFAVLSFIAHYLEDPAKIRFLEEGKYKVKYLPFDWDLNQ